MKGYYKMPEATAAAIDKDGWLHTGDLALRTPEGNYKITGRLKDMIIRGGENIYPKELEEFIYTNDKVKDVQVIGIPDEQYGEEILDSLGLLFVEKEGFRSFRYRYWLAMQTLMLENFAKKVYTWCDENGVQLTGHYVEESTMGWQNLCCA